MPFVPLKNYAAEKVVVVWRGHTFSGYAPGTFVKVARAVDGFKKTVGADGSVARSRMSDKSGEITLTLMHTSPSNDFMATSAQEDEDFGTAVGPLMVKDLLGNMLHMAQNAWIRKQPDDERGPEVGETEWVLDCDLLKMRAGGAL